MVTRDLIAAFRRACPEYERIYWETLPFPGVLVDQIREGALVTGNLARIAIRPDIFTAGSARIGNLTVNTAGFHVWNPIPGTGWGLWSTQITLIISPGWAVFLRRPQNTGRHP